MFSNNLDENKHKGMIIEIQRWSVSDGPGSRTVVFLKGCPLQCPWCANPESQAYQPQIGIFASRCVDCHACVRVCPGGVAIPAKEGAFSSDNCTQCGQCTQVCHSNARSWMGEEMSVAEIMDIVKKDMVFYRKSFGGVTFSGGEPLTQPKFLKETLKECQKFGIHTALETCGYFNWEAAKGTVGLLDFIMFDLKHMDAVQHKTLTGVSNKRILENAEKMAGLGIPMVIRIPVIPSINDSRENIQATAEFVRDHLPGVLGIEILPYHRLGLIKYAALGLDYQLSRITPPEEGHIHGLQALITDSGVTCITADSSWDALAVQTLQKDAG